MIFLNITFAKFIQHFSNKNGKLFVYKTGITNFGNLIYPVFLSLSNVSN